MPTNSNANEIEKSLLFETLFTELEEKDEYHVEGMKIEIAEQIYRLMERKHVSQSDLARKLGKNRAYISRIMKGKTNFTIETIVKIGRRLDADWEFKLVDKKKDEQSKRFIETGYGEETIIIHIHPMDHCNNDYKQDLRTMVS